MTYLALTLPGGKTIQAPAGIPQNVSVAKILGNAITIMLIIAVILTLIFLILGGIAWITSGGDKQKVGAARARITYAIIGLLVALGGFLIVSVIGYVFNVNLLNIGF